MDKRLSASAFEQAAGRLNIAARPLDMARAVLVDGEAQSAVAKREGVSRNAGCLAVNRIWRRWKDWTPNDENTCHSEPERRRW